MGVYPRNVRLVVAVPSRPSSRIGRWTWHFRHPVVPLLCAAALAWGVSRLPDGAGFAGRIAGVPITTQQAVSVEVVRLEGGGLEVIDPDHASWDRLSRLAMEQPRRVVSAKFQVTTRRQGPLFPALETREQELSLSAWVDGAWSEEDLRQAREAFFAWLGQRGGPLMPAGDITTSRVDLGNLLATLGLSLTFLVALLSLAGQARYMRVWRKERRLRRGVCGVCAYDLGAVEPVGGVRTCPECGAAWPAALCAKSRLMA